MAYTYAKPTRKSKSKTSTKKGSKYNPKEKEKRAEQLVVNTLCLEKDL